MRENHTLTLDGINSMQLSIQNQRRVSELASMQPFCPQYFKFDQYIAIFLLVNVFVNYIDHS